MSSDGAEIDVEDIERKLGEVQSELVSAMQDHGPFVSYHHGKAVIEEELDELWDEIKGDQSDEEMYDEAKQIAAMGLRFMVELNQMRGDEDVEKGK